MIDSKNPVYRPLMGVLFMCMACTFFPVMNGLAKLMSQRYSSEQVVWARTFSHLILVLLVLLPRYGSDIVKTQRPGLQILRSCMLLASTMLYFTAIKYVSIAQASSISFLAPLLVMVLAGPMLNEKVTPARAMGVVVGFIGVLVIVRPGSAVFQPASLLIVVSSLCYAIYQLLTRQVAGTDRPETSVVYSALVGSVLMSLVVPFSWTTPTGLVDCLLLASLGALGALGHYCLARAMTYAPANFVSPFNYWQMVGSVVVGYLMFAEIPDLFTWLGTALIIAAGLYVGLKSSK